MKGILALAAAALLLPAAALAGDKDEIEVVGFSADDSLFAYYTYGVYDGSGFPHAELHVYSTLTGRKNANESRKVVLEEDVGGKADPALAKVKAEAATRLDALGLGKDPGTEMYRSGTATRTSFTVDGKPVEIRLVVQRGSTPDEEVRKDRVSVRVERGGRRVTLMSGGGGFDYSLNSVRLSQSGKALAVLLKHSERGFEGPNRRYDLAAGRVPGR